MIRLVAGRLLGTIVVLFFVATFGFLALRLAKGGPFEQEGKKLTPAVRANLERELGLDQPLRVQYARFLKGLVTGELESMKRPGVKVTTILRDNFPASAQLGLLALAFAILFGVGLGVTAAARQNRWQDHAAMTAALVGISIPSFVLGPILVIWFSLKLGWLPPARWDGFRSMILPALTLGLIFVGTIARLTRAGMLETLKQDYVRTARAKGLDERRVVWKHALRLGILPVVTYLAPATAYLITGSIVVETIFQIPGLGFYLVSSVTDRDYTMLAGLMVFYCLFVLVLNLAVDIAYGFLDPRIREARR